MKRKHKLSALIPDVVRMRSEGATYDEIGSHYGLTRQRICQVKQAAERHEEILSTWGFPFSTRTFNTLEKLCIKNREEALELYKAGHLQPRSVRGFGWVQYKEICEWLGVPTNRQNLKAEIVCPHCGEPL